MSLYRSLLFVPAYNLKYIKSAINSVADVIILDLEDSVPQTYKSRARKNINLLFQEKFHYSGEIIIRVNELESLELAFDSQEIDFSKINGVMLPKINNQYDINQYEYIFKLYKKLYFIPLIETPKALINIEEIVKHPKVKGIAFGGEDYLAEIEGNHFNGISEAFRYPRSKIIISAKSEAKYAIDTPFLNIDNINGLKMECEKAKELGFNGKLCIHPKQAEQINENFSPTKEEVELANKIIQSINKAEATGTGVTVIDGKMVGPPMLKRAHKIIALHNTIRNKKVQ